jgi:nucleotide-binding universal stress UspA family protein
VQPPGKTKVLLLRLVSGPTTLVADARAKCNGGMSTETHGEILVGFSNSAASAAALRWAASEAKRGQCRIRVLHVEDDGERADIRLDALSQEAARSSTYRSTSFAQRGMDVLGDDAAEIGVTMAHQSGTLVDVLTRASAGARLLVIGKPGDCRHRGLDTRLRQVVSCPVMVVPAL